MGPIVQPARCPPSRGSGECVVVPIGKASLFSEAWPMRSLRPHQARTPSRRRFRQLGDGAFGLSVGDRLDGVEPMTSTPPATRSSLDARSARAPLDSGVPLAETTRRHPMSLLWWVFLANGAVLLLALLLLAFTPDRDPRPDRDRAVRAAPGRLRRAGRLGLGPVAEGSGTAVQAHGGDELGRPGQAGSPAVRGRSP